MAAVGAAAATPGGEIPLTPISGAAVAQADLFHQFAQGGAPSPAAFLASPEVISLRSSVNDKDIELLDLRQQLQKSLQDLRAAKVDLASKDKALSAQTKKHELAVSKLEKDILSKNENIRALSKEVRELGEDAQAQQKRLKDLAREKNQRIDVLKDEFRAQLDAAKRHQKGKEDGEERILKLKRDLSLAKHEKKLSEDLSQNEHARLKSRIQELTVCLDQSTKDCARLRGATAQKEVEVRRLRQECDDKEKHLLLAASQARFPDASAYHAAGIFALHERKENAHLDNPAAAAAAAASRRLDFELYEKEHRHKLESMQQSMYRLQVSQSPPPHTHTHTSPLRYLSSKDERGPKEMRPNNW